MQQLRRHGDAKDEAQRWQCDQARIQAAALNGELGPRAQILAMSAAYGELVAAGRIDEARALKAQAMQVRERAG